MASATRIARSVWTLLGGAIGLWIGLALAIVRDDRPDWPQALGSAECARTD
jgi:hypothetical protein